MWDRLAGRLSTTRADEAGWLLRDGDVELLYLSNLARQAAAAQVVEGYRQGWERPVAAVSASVRRRLERAGIDAVVTGRVWPVVDIVRELRRSRDECGEDRHLSDLRSIGRCDVSVASADDVLSARAVLRSRWHRDDPSGSGDAPVWRHGRPSLLTPWHGPYVVGVDVQVRDEPHGSSSSPDSTG